MVGYDLADCLVRLPVDRCRGNTHEKTPRPFASYFVSASPRNDANLEAFTDSTHIIQRKSQCDRVRRGESTDFRDLQLPGTPTIALVQL